MRDVRYTTVFSPLRILNHFREILFSLQWGLFLILMLSCVIGCSPKSLSLEEFLRRSKLSSRDITPPEIHVISPLNNTSVNSSNQAAFSVSGTCSESGLDLQVASSPTGYLTTTACNQEKWNLSADLSAVPDGPFDVSFTQTDLAGNLGSTVLSLTKVTATPDAPLVKLSPALAVSPFIRSIEIDSETYVSVTHTGLFLSCQMPDSAYQSCSVSNGRIDVSDVSTGGNLCIKSSNDNNIWSSETCVALPKFKAAHCDYTVTTENQPADFGGLQSLVNTYSVLCFENGVMVTNPATSTVDRISVTNPNTTLIAQRGASVQISNLRNDGGCPTGCVAAQRVNSIFNCAATSCKIVGFTLNSVGTDGFGIQFNLYGDQGQAIQNIITTTGYRGKGIFATGANSVISKGNTITTTQMLARPIEYSRGSAAYLTGGEISYNVLDSNFNQAHGITLFQTADSILVTNNIITFLGNGNTHGIFMQSNSINHTITNNVIRLKPASGAGHAISVFDANSGVAAASGNLTCSLGGNYSNANTINDASLTLTPVWNVPMQVQIGGPCP